ncbi:MAG: class IV adenylate cyclase [Candidatus Woesearchaeota archaeon]
MEIELRAKVSPGFQKNLKTIGAKFISKKSQKDEYFRFKLDKKRKLIIRIRNNKILTFKGSSACKKDIAWQEWETCIKNAKQLKELFLLNGLIKVATIEKTRKQYKLDNITINYDSIKDLGFFIEAEIIGNNLKQGKKQLEELFLNKLRINKKDIIYEGYVKLMLKSAKRIKIP